MALWTLTGICLNRVRHNKPLEPTANTVVFPDARWAVGSACIVRWNGQ